MGAEQAYEWEAFGLPDIAVIDTYKYNTVTRR